MDTISGHKDVGRASRVDKQGRNNVVRASRDDKQGRNERSNDGTSKDRTSGPQLTSEEAARAPGLTSRGAKQAGRRAVQIVYASASMMSILCQGICI